MQLQEVYNFLNNNLKKVINMMELRKVENMKFSKLAIIQNN